MADLFYVPGQPVFDADGKLVSGALVYFFYTGTSTPAPIYTSAALTTPLTNPVVADSSGRLPSVYLAANVVYRVRVTGPLGEGAREYDPYVGFTDSISLSGPTGAALVGTRPPGSGAVSTTVAAELYRTVYVDQYGAKGDYDPVTGTGTNDTPAFMAAAAILGARGGRIHIPRGFRCLIDTDAVMPDNVIIEGSTMQLATGLAAAGAANAAAGDIYVNENATISIGSSGGLRHCNVFRKGIQWNLTSAQVVATYKGTGVTIRNPPDNGVPGSNQTRDHIFDDIMVAGFENGIMSELQSGPGGCDRTRFTNRCYFDNINNINIYNAFDVPVFDGAVEGWPFVTYSSPAETNGAQLKRNGKHIWLHGVNDWTKINESFNYGWRTGFEISNCRSVTLTNCGSDYPYQSAADGSSGFFINGAAAEIRLIGCQAAQRDSGIIIDSTSPLIAAHVIGANLWESRINGIAVTRGKVQVIGGSITSAFAGSNGVQTASTSGLVTVTAMDFRNIAVALANDNATVFLTHHCCTFENVSMVASNPFIARITASDPLVPPLNADGVVVVDGNTSFGTVAQANIYAGKSLTFVFTGTLTVADGGADLKINGNFNATPTGTLTLASTGTQWFEVGRSAN